MFDTSPAAFYLLHARRAEELAGELATRSARLAHVDLATEWDGPAARAFRRQAGDLLDLLRHATVALEHVAVALRREGAVAEAAAEAAAERREHEARELLRRVGVP